MRITGKALSFSLLLVLLITVVDSLFALDAYGSDVWCILVSVLVTAVVVVAVVAVVIVVVVVAVVVFTGCCSCDNNSGNRSAPKDASSCFSAL